MTSDWYLKAEPGEWCDHDTRCEDAEPDGICETCDTVDGRWVPAVCEYASTCDGCGLLTNHDQMTAENEDGSGLGYCHECVRKGKNV